MTTLTLIGADGGLAPYTPRFPEPPVPSGTPPRSRRAYAAVHVVADSLSDAGPYETAAIDLDATLHFRHHIWSCGLGVAEAMDTAQRGMGLGWTAARWLIEHSAREASSVGGELVCGATTDQLPREGSVSLSDLIAAYAEQLEFIEGVGARAAIMPSRQLARTARSGDDYLEVYDALLSQVARPTILHWLGPAFDPLLAGYWGSDDADVAAEVVLELCRRHHDRLEGVKLSLLDVDLERRLRARLPASVRLLTGDDYNYPGLIAGDGSASSDALLGVFDPLAPLASSALARLDEGNIEAFHALLDPTVPLARQLFRAPTKHYKTGVVFLAWLNGHQTHFRMIAGAESKRSLRHLCELFRLADEAAVLTAPDVAVERMRALLTVGGVAQDATPTANDAATAVRT